MTPGKIVIAPDSFKGALTSKRVADIIGEELQGAFPVCDILRFPIADGGEGSLDTILSVVGGDFFSVNVISPDDQEITARYGITPDGTAVLEMAQSSGIVRQNSLNPMTSSTFGFGQMILDALNRGARSFVFCIGGSASTDGGCGMAAALGVRFLDAKGKGFTPCGANLESIAKIEMSGLDSRIDECSISVMCDVDNPLYGEKGAAFSYGAQKGASASQMVALDFGLRNLNERLAELGKPDFGLIPGAGAAGGLGAGCMAFLKALLKPGSKEILSLCGFEKAIYGADLIITGEGQLDQQSFMGKAITGIIQQAKGIPVYSICGINRVSPELLASHGVIVFETSEGVGQKASFMDPEKYLRKAAQRVAEYINNLEE